MRVLMKTIILVRNKIMKNSTSYFAVIFSFPLFIVTVVRFVREKASRDKFQKNTSFFNFHKGHQ